MNIKLMKIILFLVPKNDYIKIMFYNKNETGIYSHWLYASPADMIIKIKDVRKNRSIKTCGMWAKNKDSQDIPLDKIFIIDSRLNYKNFDIIWQEYYKQRNIFLIFLKIFQLRLTLFVKNVLLLSN